MKKRSMVPIRESRSRLAWLALAIVSLPATAQSPVGSNQAAENQDLATAIQELRAQVQELRTTVTEMKSEAAEYRAQSDQLRKELETIRANATVPNSRGAESSSSEAVAGAAISQKLASLDETTQLLGSEIRTQYQTKVESA